MALAPFDGKRGIADGQFRIAFTLRLGFAAFHHQTGTVNLAAGRLADWEQGG
jgi:hypothetical protein